MECAHDVDPREDALSTPRADMSVDTTMNGNA